VAELSVIFRTQSDIEANVVRGLLETHGIQALLSSDGPHSVFPLTIDGLGEVRLSVRADDAARAQHLISAFRAEVSARAVRIRDEFTSLEADLGHPFRDRGLLEHALTHRSRAHEDASGGVIDNESLEFLGDAVLGFVIADRLFRKFPDYDEGQKSKVKAALVSAASLTKLGVRLRLGEHLLLGRGEEKSGGRKKPSLIADTFEAVVAAIYLDGGMTAAEAFIERQFRAALEQVRAGGAVSGLVADHKSALQEWVQAHDLSLPEYRLAGETGPDHCKIFQVEVLVGGNVIAGAEGRSKKEAEQKAARLALAELETTGHGAEATNP
jgi:ribonuclease III